MTTRIVTVFGGTGFLGRRVVRQFRRHGYAVRVASRHPDRAPGLFSAGDTRPLAVKADIHDKQSVADAISGAYGVVNAVSLYVERGAETFHSVHVEAAQRLAARARQADVERLVHVSGIGADAASPSRYIRKRGEGEGAVRGEFADTTVIRPAVMVGAGDAFLTPIVKLIRWFPVFPMFGRGETRLQPAHVQDVAEAIVRLIDRDQAPGKTFECGGPQVYSYEELLRTVARQAGRKRWLVPIPFGAWHVLARMAEMLPRAPVTRNQVELMQFDNVPSPNLPGFAELGISPRAVDDILREMMKKR